MENEVQVTINGQKFSVQKGSTILDACKKANIAIPTLCYMKDLCDVGACGVCVVEVAKAKTLQRACITEVGEGMDIQTHTPRVREARKVLVELLLANHPKDCLSCDRNETCELRQLSYDLGIKQVRFEQTKELNMPLDETSLSIVRDRNKCILCRRCVEVCDKVQSVNVINVSGRGMGSKISTFQDMGLGSSYCTNCGQCVLVCPTGALMERSEIDKVWKALSDPKKVVLVEAAPAVRVAIGEEFGMPPGSLVTGKMAAALRQLGFNKIFDTQFTADLTIIEEGTEFLNRVKNALTGKSSVLPMITSCSPGWIKYIEHAFPDQLAHLSTCKSPHMMLGAVVKSYYANKLGLEPADIFVVSVMPCTAKKTEITRPEMMNNGVPNVDAVLTCRELAEMIREAGIDFVNVPDREFDNPLGMSTGAADIFGVTGGVMEAALRPV